MAELLPSLSSDEEGQLEGESEDEEFEANENFEFGGILGEDGGITLSNAKAQTGWSYGTALQQIEKKDIVDRMDVASLIAAKRKALQSKENEAGEDDLDDIGKQEEPEDRDSIDENDTDDDEEEDMPIDDSHKGMEDDMLKTRVGKNDDDDDEVNDKESDDDENDDKEESAKAAAFFDDETTPQTQNIELFAELTLSRPILRGVADMGFVKPTPIQSAVIPLALAGRDICASAVTGSGKTAAFLLPTMERLLHRYSGRIKAIVLTPTRELAAQCLGMLTTFGQYTNIRASLIVGGSKNVQAQAAELRARPDIVVATPGRLLDHIINTPGVSIDDVEFLILDEADRLLDLGFQDEVHELIKACPVKRQTLLFSATMNTKVDDLIKLSLKRPVRVRISNKQTQSSRDIEVAPRLEQEFIRIRAGNEGLYREAILLALLTRTYKRQVIVFFDTKANAHRLMIICGLCGIKCTELHGNLTQQQRLSALEEFRNDEVDVLLATDLAARGLDISRVKTVINFEMPSQIETYIHRIGRTARAGRGGTGCTLIGEGRRHLMKDLIKEAEKKSKDGFRSSEFEKGVIRSRVVPPAVVSHFVTKIESLEAHIEEILQAETVDKMDRLAEMEVIRAQNIIEHSDAINSRPQREWFASEKEKQLSKEAAREKQRKIAESVGTGTHRMTRKKRRAREAREALTAPDPSNDIGERGDEELTSKKRIVNSKALARATKRKEVERDREAAGKSINEQFVEASQKIKEKKRTRVADAAGDGSLFDEEKVSFSNKSKKAKEETTVAKSTYQFHGYDPEKKLGKKKSHHKFKSKSKYRRR